MALSKIEMEILVERSKAKAALKEIRPEPLENGERMTRAEFERRYEAMPHIKKAELIEGVGYMPSPVRHNRHAKPHRRVNAWITLYCEATPGTDAGDNGTVRLDEENEPQPDISLFIEDFAGGAIRVSDDDYLEGAPELVFEVSASSKFVDLFEKKEAYRRNGVKEYVVWSVNDRKLDWFRLITAVFRCVRPNFTAEARRDAEVSQRRASGLCVSSASLRTSAVKFVFLGYMHLQTAVRRNTSTQPLMQTA